MPTLIICQGLPGSGKTTFALDQMKQNPTLVRVNRDEIRLQLCPNGWSQEAETTLVVPEQTCRIQEALANGWDVISDDTNLAPSALKRLKDIAKSCGVLTYTNEQFLSVPVEECIRRDALREGKARVGPDVIKKMARQYLDWIDYTPVVYDPKLPSCIICDLDGTLALHNGRNPYDCERAGEDDINETVDSILDTYNLQSNYCGTQTDIVYLSGREEKCRKVTEDWLSDHYCAKGKLWMRPTGDRRNDAVVKAELFEAHIRGKYNVQFVLDDRDRVVKMWRKLGLTCLQVAEGAF